jgi:hypothetical protein
MQFDEFMAGRPTADEFDPVARTTQRFCQQPQQRLIGCVIDGRRRYLHAQFVTQWFADFVD